MTELFSPVSRRAFFSGLAMTVGGAAALSACSPREDLSVPTAGDKNVKESPALAEKIKAGDLPKLEERLPKTPMQQETLSDKGRYGGTLRIAQTTPTDAQPINSHATYGLLEWNLMADDYVPSLAEKYEANEDNTVHTFTMREGVKWSDGEPLTIDDALFAFNDVLLNKTLTPAPPVWLRNADGSDVTVENQDGKLVVTFAQPYALFDKYMRLPFIGPLTIKPKHYLQQFHPTYTDPAALDAASKKAGFDSWDQYYSDRDDAWTNKERPTAGAFVVASPLDAQSGAAVMERNPFYYKTDKDGRQLPYIDKVQVQVLDEETLNLRAANGELDYQGRWLSYGSTQVLQQNADSRGYTIQRWKPGASQLNVFPNLSHKDDEIRELMQAPEFRAALSQAINRDELNDQLLGGLGTYRQFVAGPDDPYYVKGIGERYLDFDLDAANSLLDGLGLAKGASGLRTTKSGKPLELVILFVESTGIIPLSDALQSVAEAWNKLGMKVSTKAVDDTLYFERLKGNDYDVIAYTGATLDWDLEPVWYVPTDSLFRTGPAFGAWMASGGKEGMEPPQAFKDLSAWWAELSEAPNDDERIAAGRKISQHWDENVYVIGVLDVTFRPVLVSKKVGNARHDENLVVQFYRGFDGITKPEQLYMGS